VEAFLEKPSRRLAEEALRQGALWNTLVAAARARALWDLGWRVLPEFMPSFIRYREALRAGHDGAAIERLYTEVPSLDFSSDLLQRAPERLKVLELEGVAWSDWGRPERILETLTALGLPAAFPQELVA
jgi:mannose-1-phosphate guanylyltransferase